jgi:hypothetical protein
MFISPFKSINTRHLKVHFTQDTNLYQHSEGGGGEREGAGGLGGEMAQTMYVHMSK